MAGGFLAEVDVEIDYSDVASFESAVTRALSEIAAKADAAGRGGQGGLSGDVREFGRQVAGGVLSNTSAAEQQRFLSALEQALSRGFERIQRAAPSFRPPSFETIEQQARRDVGGESRNRARTGSVRETGTLDQFVQEEIDSRRKAARGAGALADSPEFLRSSTDAETQNRRLAAGLDRTRSGSREFLDAGTDATTQANLRQAAQLSNQANSEEFNDATAALAASRKQEAAAEARALAGSDDYAQASSQAAIALKELAARNSNTLGSKSVLDAGTNAATQENLRKASELSNQANSDEYNESTVALAASRKQAAARESEALLADSDYAAATQAAALARKQIAAVEAEAALSEAAINADARTSLAKSRASAAVRAQVIQGTTPEDTDLAGANQAAAARVKVAQSLAEYSARTQDDIAQEAQLIAAKKAYTDALNVEVAQAKGSDGRLGFTGRGSFLQRLQGQFRINQNNQGYGDNANFRTGGEFLGEHAVRTAGFALPGLAFGVGIEELRNSVQEAEQAQRAFAELQAEFEGLGQGSQFQGFKTSIQDIANESGLAVSEVAELGQVLKGAFGSTDQATIALQGVAQAAVAMGLSVSEANDDLVAIDKAFGEFGSQGGSAIQNISNEALHLQDLTGEDAKGIIAGTADLGPIANQVGLSYKQTASLIAGTAQVSGQTPETIGQNYATILPAFQQNAPEILSYFQQLPQLQKDYTPLANDFSKGKGGDAFELFLKDFQKVSGVQQENLASILGNPRYTQQLLAGSQNAAKIEQIQNTTAPQDRTTEEYQKQLATLEGTFDRLRSAATNFGVAVVDSGAGTALEEVADAVGQVLKFFTDLNSITDGVAGKIAGLTAALLGLRVALQFGGLAGDVVGNLRGVGSQAEVTATQVKLSNGAIVSSDEAAAAGIIPGVTGDAGLLGRLKSGPSSIGNAFTNPLSLRGGNLAPTAADSEGALSAGTDVGEGFAATEGLEAAPLAISEMGTAAGEATTSLAALGPAIAVILTALAGFKIGSLINNTLDNKHSTAGRVLRDVDPGLEVFKSGVSEAAKLYDKATGAGDHATFNSQRAAENVLGVSPGNFLNNRLPSADQKAVTDLANLSSGDDGKVGSRDYKAAFAALQAAERAAGLKVATLKKNVTDQKAALTALNADADKGVVSYQDVQEAYEAGDASLANLNKAIADQIKNLQASAADGNTEAIDQLYQLKQTQAQLLDQQAQSGEQLRQSLIPQGSTAKDAEKLRSITGEIKQLKSPADQLSAVNDYMSGLQTFMQDEVSNATTGAAKIAAATQTVKLPPAIQKILQQYGINATSYTGSLTSQQRYQDLSQDTSAQGALATSNANEDPLAQAKAALTTANLNVVNALKTEGSSSDDYINAEAAAKSATTAYQDQVNDVTSAQIAVQAALDAPDAIKSAQDAITAANQAEAAARGPAAQLQAQAQQIQANQAYATAVQTIADAQASVLEAMLTAAGNTAGAAAYALKQAQKDYTNRLQFDKVNNINPADDATTQGLAANVYTAQAASQQATIQQVSDTNDALVALGKETLTQEISALEAQLPAIAGNQALTLQVQQKIRSLQTGNDANLNFNIPSNLLISPTLYQAERVQQSTGGYQDNRNVQVTIQVNNSSQNPGAVNQLLKAIGGTASTSGTTAPLLNA